MISSQASDANTITGGSCVGSDIAKVSGLSLRNGHVKAGSSSLQLRIAQRLLTTMVVATGVSSVMSLQFFLQVNWSVLISKFVTLKEFYVRD